MRFPKMWYVQPAKPKISLRLHLSKCHIDGNHMSRLNYSFIDLAGKEALAIRRIFSLVDIITKAKFSNSPNDFKIRLFG